MAPQTAIPDFETVWPRIQRRAQELKDAGQAIRTLKEGLLNTIEDVHDGGIVRRSERPRTGAPSLVPKSHFKAIWDWLAGLRARPGTPTTFVYPLMLAALGDLVEEDESGAIRLKAGR